MGRRPGEGVIAFLLGVALAANCALDEAVAEVRDGGDKAAYLCLVHEGGGAAAAAAIGDGEEPRLRRAIALWLLQRYDIPFDPALVTLLNPADVRLLADGIKARRGRKSPVPEHEAVFSQFDWYKPLDTYTDGRLRPVDRANLDALTRPPVEPEPEQAEPAPLAFAKKYGVAFLIGGVLLAAVAAVGMRARKA